MTQGGSTGVRLAFLGVVVVALFSALFARIWYLQVLATDEYQVQAATNRVRLISIPPIRGRILDRNGVVLADNEFVGVVTVDPTQVGAERDRVLDELELLTGESRDLMAARLDDPAADPFAPRTVAAGLDENTLELIAERALPGVKASFEPRRVYPQKAFAAHVVGYVGAMPEGFLEAHRGQGYTLNDRVGRAGIEDLFEEELRGRPGVRKVEVDRQNRVLRILGEEPPQNGYDVVLTIDIELQQAVEAYLALGLRDARQKISPDSDLFFPAYAGAAVVEDVRNGQILAMASYPTFDPNWLVDGLSSDLYDLTFNDPFSPGRLNNRAIQGLYPAGSTFKLVTAIAGSRAGVISPRGRYEDVGYFDVPGDCGTGCRFNNAGKAIMGPMDLSTAISRSSDAYFYSTGYKIWALPGENQWAIQDTARQFGFGSDTGIQLPFEKSGRVPDDEVKRVLFESRPDVYLTEDNVVTWVPGDNINLAIGQGFLTMTPLQLTNAYATWANGGTRFAPNIVDRVQTREDAEPEIVTDFGPRITDVLDFSDIPRDVINEGLAGVTRVRRTAYGVARGTASGAFELWDNAAYPISGKTGTAQAEGINKALARPKEDTALFVGYGPTNDPRYAVTVIMEEAGFGGDAAAPVVRNIFDALRRLEQNWAEPEDLPLETPQPVTATCPEIPRTLLHGGAEVFVPEGCPYGTPLPVIGTPSDGEPAPSPAGSGG